MAALGVCIVVLLGSGVAAALTIEDAPAAATSATPTTVIDTNPPPEPIDLAAIVVPGPPGFDRIPDAGLPVAGTVDLERLAAERGEQTRSVFVETRLMNGFVRAWQKPSSSELVTVRLYQFTDATGAASYAKRVISAMSRAPATTFTVPATTDTVGVDTHTQKGVARLAFIISRRGRVVAAIAANVATAPEAGFLAPLARSQLSMLP